MKAWQEEQVQVLLNGTSATELFRQLTILARQLSFDYCSYGIRMPLPISSPRTEVFSNYSESWKKCYQEQNYLAVDPSVVRGGKSIMPFLWSNELFSTAPELWEDARAHGLEFGWAQSCRDAQGISGMLTLSRSHENLTGKELQAKTADMSWLVQLTHFGMARCLTPILLPEAEVTLSHREIEVLRWTAEGKTSGEIADILRIAERTVNFHLSNAVTKLNASNKTSAAIRASVLGLLY
jgi:LuxR family quorum-sensing system transcriptional regulator SolR